MVLLQKILTDGQMPIDLSVWTLVCFVKGFTLQDLLSGSARTITGLRRTQGYR